MTEKPPKSVIVTGASGFIGAWVLPALAQKGHAVYPVSREAREWSVDCDEVLTDLAEPGWTAALPERADCLIWLAQSRRYKDGPDGHGDVSRINEAAFMEGLEWARQAGVARVLLASSGSVYAPQDRPLIETDPVDPTTAYTSSKLNAEYLLKTYSSHFEAVAVRLFTPYGPGPSSMLMARMYTAVLGGHPIELANGTGPVLSPIYAADVAEAFSQLMTCPLVAPLARVNVAGPEAVTLANIVTELGARLGKKPVTHNPLDAETPIRLVADIGVLRTMLPDLALTPVNEGLGAWCDITGENSAGELTP